MKDSFRIGDWLVRPAHNTISSSEQEIRVEHRVMEVLVYLAEHAGKVVTKEELNQEVWEGAFVTDEVLTNSIWELRKALGDDAKKPRFIQTVPRKGYRLIATVEAVTAAAHSRSPKRWLADRYQTLKDVVVDLRATRRQRESGMAAPFTERRPRRRKPWAYAAILATLMTIALAGVLVLRPPPEPPPGLGSRSSVAVLLFDNINEDPSLDWLRLGIAEMLITDLSQSPDLQVVSTDRLYQIMKDMKRLDEPITSLDVVQEVAERANSGTVILGSFIKSGDALRINTRVQDAQSGEILTTEKVEGTLGSEVFSMVDELTRRIRSQLATSIADSSPDLYLRDVTTPSIEAYRHYIEGLRFIRKGEPRKGIGPLEKAIELDPGFASALNTLGIAHWNSGNIKKGMEYFQRAFEHAERATPLERLFVEGSYYLNREETVDRAIEAFKRAIELFPYDLDSRHDLAFIYLTLERYEEANEHFQLLIDRNTPDYTTYTNIARSYMALGQLDRGVQALRKYIARYPDHMSGYRALGFHLIRCGKLEQALEALDKAESLGLPYVRSQNFRWNICVLREDWDEAGLAAKKIEDASDPNWKWQGAFQFSIVSFYRGHSEDALSLLNQCMSTFEEQDPRHAWAHNYAAHVLLESGQAELAQDHAIRAQREDQGNPSQWEGLYHLGRAEALLGHYAKAEETAEELRAKTHSIPSEKEKRRYHHLRGEIALASGETSRAIDLLEQAQSMLPPRGFRAWGQSPQHVPIWFSLARAHLAAGDEQKASPWLHRITESTTEHIWWPIPYVRSFYFLGKTHENRGEMEKAREYYRRFYEYWKDGDMDRERVEEAKSKLGIT